MKENSLAAFENYKIRRVYDEKSETWYFSVVDIIAALVQQPDYQAARKYWKVLKGRLAKERSELVTNCYQLKMAAEDGKLRLTDVASAESVDATGMIENAEAGKKGGGIAKRARRELEQKTGRSVVTGENFLPPPQKPKRLKGKNDE